MRVSLKDLPPGARRIAAQHLESLRGSEAAPNGALYLGAEAVAIYRPDIEAVAYWEFHVFDRQQAPRHFIRTPSFDGTCDVRGAKGDAAEPAGVATPVGFIVVSNGRHDFPVAHWSLNRLPPSVQLAADPQPTCAASEQGGAAVRMYRLDALSYAAENAAGEIAGRAGQLPALVRGLPHDLARNAGQIASSVARTLRHDRSDESASQAQHTLERSKEEPPKLVFGEEVGWKLFKAAYADVFGPLLAQLRDRAARTWELEDAIAKYGEGIIAGSTLRVALLDEACIEISGEGAKHIRATVTNDGAPALLLQASDVSLQRETDFTVTLQYQSGEREQRLYFVVSRDVPSNTKAEQANRCSSDCEE